MAFPTNSHATGAAARADFANRCTDQGLALNASFSSDDALFSVAANLFSDVPEGCNVGYELPTGPAAGITGGTGTICKTSITKEGGIIVTRFLIDLTGLSAAAAGDIIGAGTAAAYIGKITAAANGTIIGGRMICFEAPAGGDADIDLYAATEATGKLDDAITGLAETQAINGGTQTLGAASVLIADSIAANKYLYLVSVGATAAAYTAGRLFIELYGV